MKKYTHRRIEGELPKVNLPKDWGLVLEGGGTRGSYTAGVLDAFLKENIMFHYIVGISAGAAYGLSYVSGQKGRNKLLIEHHIHKKKYMSLRNLLKNNSFINRDYVFREIQEEHLFFDWEMFQKNRAKLLSGAFDCEEGSTVWLEKEEIDQSYLPIIASSAIPFVSPMVEIKGKKLLDGGILSPIPIEKSIADGNQFHVIVLTQHKGYRKSPANLSMAKLFYTHYDKVLDSLEERHHNYNKQLDLCEQLEAEGKAIILRPREKVEVGMAERDVRKLLHLFSRGEEDGAKTVEKMKWMLEKSQEEDCIASLNCI